MYDVKFAVYDTLCIVYASPFFAVYDTDHGRALLYMGNHIHYISPSLTYNRVLAIKLYNPQAFLSHPNIFKITLFVVPKMVI